jgi:nucleoside-diphosphate-sugar epimerase
MTIPRPIAAVTGSSGYLGERICTTLESRGWHIRRLGRSRNRDDPFSGKYDLTGPVDPQLLQFVDVLIHTAYDFSLTKRSDIWRVNVEGSRRLVSAARDAGVRRILVLSTMSAYAGTTQLYGQAKLDIETATASVGGCAIRPGLVYSDQPAGMAGALQKITRLPFVPVVAPNARQFLVHIDDLMTAIAALAGADTLPSGPLGIANATPVSFRDLLAGLASQEGRRCRFVPIPWRVLYWGLRAGELSGMKLPFRADSLMGLVCPAPSVPGADQVARLGVTFRPFALLPEREYSQEASTVKDP